VPGNGEGKDPCLLEASLEGLQEHPPRNKVYARCFG